MSMTPLEKILDKFNNGELDAIEYFGGYDQFFNLLKKKGLFSYIDPINGSESQYWQNRFMLWLLENDKEKFNLWVEKLLDDVEFDESGKPFLILSDRGELSNLFCGSRNSMDPKTIESILSDDGDFDGGYWDTTDNVYRDVIEELNDDNIKILYSRIVKELKDQDIPTDTDYLESLTEDQDDSDVIRINENNIEGIVDDEETMMFLLNNYLDEIKSDLYSIHSTAYNDAYQSEVYDEIWSKLETFFEGTGEWITKPHPYKKNVNIQLFKVPIVNFESNIKDFLVDNLKYTDTLENNGNYIRVLVENGDCLRAWAPDYPDSRKIDQNINLLFSDYF